MPAIKSVFIIHASTVGCAYGAQFMAKNIKKYYERTPHKISEKSAKMRGKRLKKRPQKKRKTTTITREKKSNKNCVCKSGMSINFWGQLLRAEGLINNYSIVSGC